MSVASRLAARRLHRPDQRLESPAPARGHHVRAADAGLRARVLHPAAAARRPDVGERLEAAGRRQGHQLPARTTGRSTTTRCSGRPSSSPSATRSSSPSCSSAWASASPCSCRRRSRWVGMLRTVFLIPLAVGLAAASLLFWGFYSDQHRAREPAPPGRRADRQADPVLRDAHERLPLDGLHDRLEVRRPVHAHPAGRPAGHPDGAATRPRRSTARGRWQTFRHITLPLLRPSLALALILCVTGSLLAFDHFYLLTKGGPDNSTVTIVQLIYQQAFVRQNLGTAAALSIVLLVALLILNLDLVPPAATRAAVA